MTIRRLIAFVATAGLILALAACGGGGSKNSATKTATSKTPRSNVTGTITPKTTATGNGTPGAATSTSQGGGQGTPPAGQATTQSSSTAVRATPISGAHSSYRVQFTVASDPANLQPLVKNDGRFSSRLTVVIGTGAISFNGDGPFITVGGTIDASGAFSATGMGRIEPYRNVEATFQGTISNGQLTGTYALGTNGALPGAQPITYNVTGTNQEAQTPPG